MSLMRRCENKKCWNINHKYTKKFRVNDPEDIGNMENMFDEIINYTIYLCNICADYSMQRCCLCDIQMVDTAPVNDICRVCLKIAGYRNKIRVYPDDKKDRMYDEIISKYYEAIEKNKKTDQNLCANCRNITNL